MNCPDVLAVVVTFNPRPYELRGVLESLMAQVGGVAVIDNTPTGVSSEVDALYAAAKEVLGAQFFLVINLENKGIAAAQNQGVRIASEHGYRFVFLSDQDSSFPPDVVNKLRVNYEELVGQGKMVGAIGAGYVNRVKDGVSAPGPIFIQHEGFRARRVSVPHGVVCASYLIASGCLIPTAVLQVVGGKDESFFIDWVDTEWCLRAQTAGYEVFGSADAVVDHRLGDDVVRVFGRPVALHSPVRHYYMVRNALRLAVYRDVMSPFQRLRVLCSAVLFMVFFPLLAKPHLGHLRMVTLGFWHGLVNKKGSLRD